MGDAYTERTSLAKGAKDLAKEAKRHAVKKVNKVVDRASDEYSQRSYSRFQNEDDEDDDNYYYRQDGGYTGGANEEEGSSDATEGHDDEDEIYEGEYQGIPAGGQAQGNQVAMGKLVSDGQKDRKELETERQADEEELAQQYELIIQECGHGRFQWQLFLVLGLALMSDGVEVFVVGFVLPSAETDMCIPDSGAGWLGSIPDSYPTFSPLSEPPKYHGLLNHPLDVIAGYTQSPEEDESRDNKTSVVLAGQSSNGSHCKIAKVKRLLITKKDTLFLTGSLVTTVIPSIYILVFILSVPLNAAAIFMFALRIRPKKPAAIYMLNLATADLLFVLLLPFKAAYHYNGNDWVFGSAMCRVVTFAFYCNMYCSVLLITCISTDRFLAVVYPIRAMTWRSQRNAVVVCCTTWLLAVAGVMPFLLSEQIVCLPKLGITTCHDVLDIREQQGYYRYFFSTISCLFFFIPLIITTACYVCIIRALHRSNDSKHSKKTQAVVMAVTVLTVFVVCFTPSNVLLIIHYTQFAHQPNGNSYIAYLISMCIGSVNCCLDPIIYYFGSSQCRKKVAQLLSSKVSAETS